MTEFQGGKMERPWEDTMCGTEVIIASSTYLVLCGARLTTRNRAYYFCGIVWSFDEDDDETFLTRDV